MRFIFSLVVMLFTSSLFAADITPARAEAILLLNKQGLSIESLAATEKTRVENIKKHYPNISDEAILKINKLFNPELMINKLAEIADQEIGLEGLHDLNSASGTPEYLRTEDKYKDKLQNFQTAGKEYMASVALEFVEIIRAEVDPKAFNQAPTAEKKSLKADGL